VALAGLGVALVVAGLLVPGRLALVYRAWMALALAISRFTTPVLMAVLYFGLFTPLSLAMRLFGRRPLARRRDASTFLVARPANARRSDLRRQF
jgi:dihydrodipicolinate synthase/N-acetylneuraminate lyase